MLMSPRIAFSQFANMALGELHVKDEEGNEAKLYPGVKSSGCKPEL
jgi:hypothetical protein